MAWKWFWNTETQYYDGEITRDTDWGGDASTENQPVSGGRVQEWLKNEINGKFGVIRMSNTINEQNFYSLEMFATKEDEELYDNDPDTYADRLTRVTIPISTVQGDSFSAMLTTTLPMNDIVVVDGKLNVGLNFRAIRYTQGQASNESARGTLTIQRSTDGGSTYSPVGTIPNALISSEPTDTTTVQTIDLGGYLAQGKQLIRVRASYEYEDTNSGETRTMNSAWVNLGASVTRTSLRLVLVTNYEQPMSAYDANNNVNPFSVTYTVYGSTQKTMYVKIDNGTPITYTYDSSVDSINKTISANSASYLTHGVHKVEAWLECQDGLGNTLKSDVLVNRFMMVNNPSGTEATKAYLLLQNVDSTIDNFVQTEIAEYAVYNPSGENVNVAFLLTAYSEDYETSKPEEYFRLETTVEPNKKNSLLTTIEIENENEGTEIAKYDTYFRVRRVTDTTNTDFMNESTGEKSYYVIVDNSKAFTPVSGATFLMNPKVRNNNEDNPKRILNAKNNNAEVASVWTNFGFINDGWMTADDGQKVLRIMAGSTLEIKKNVWAQFLTNPNSAMTFEMDFKIDNVTNLTDPIVQMFESTTSSFKGLCMNALEGWVMNASNTSKDDCLFSWQEGVRTHMSINLHHQVKPNKGDVNYTAENASKADGILALARVLINGDCVREIPFSVTNVNEWCSSTSGSIIIGNEGADIDIYSIRVYENKVVEMTDILNRNYLASLPTSDEKTKLHDKNDLLDGGRISLEKTKNKGLNSYVWHGTLPYHGNQAEQSGWVEIFRYDSDGNYLPEYSGTICKATKSLTGKGQGSTAKTYYDWNLQEDSSKVEATIQVAIDKVHSEIHVGTPYTGEDGKQYVDIYGGNLGKNIPIETEDNAQAYPYSNGMITVPDGWIDGNGMYRGSGYRVAEGTSLAQKRVIKINYASSMQSHLIGACNTYDLLHRKVVGDTPLQQVIPSAVSAKRTEPFMFFNQQEGGEVYFKGMGTYGAGKADKVTWGFVKKQMPMYALIEGSDNNLPMTGYRVPFDKNTAVYDCDGEGWLYNGQQSWDFDLGETESLSTSTQPNEGWKFVEGGDNKIPTKAIRDKWADRCNFIYLNSSNIRYYNGSFDSFKESDKATDTNYKYWCTSDFKLRRYDFINKEWIDAGLLVNDSYMSIDLRTYMSTKQAYNDWANGGTGDYSLLNESFVGAMVATMRKYLKYFDNEKSLQFNYCYVLGFLAGTDNSDKNTYNKIMPYAAQVEEDAEFTEWFFAMFGKTFDYSAVHQVYQDGDDMDSIFRTNNNSHQTKPYYIDRMHPYTDGSTESLYEGMGNQLFNFVEKAYEGTNELSSMMNQIMIAATELVNEDDKIYGLESGKKSLWGFLHKYFFNIQHYFPQIAYMEQARIRYEFPKLLGFISSGGGARNIDPITQSLGSQLQNELQYMNQRVIYMTSYAAFGAWGGDTTHSIGLGDANETFSFTPAAMPDGSGSTYTFTITPHQYIYPSYYNGQTFTSTHQRTSPSQTCTFTIAENVTTSDSGMGICGINYISDLGNFENKSITSDLIINGKRLVRIEHGWVSSPFRPKSLTIKALNIIDCVMSMKSVVLNSVDCSDLIRLNNVTIRAKNVIYPQSSNLTKILYFEIIENIELNNNPNLRILSKYEGYITALRFIHIGQNVGTNTGLNLQPIVESIYTAQKSQSNPALQSIHVENVNWTDFDVEALSWFADRPTCEFKGTIAIKEDSPTGVPRVTWDLKNKFISKFGNVDSLSNDLKLTYNQRDFNSDTAKIKGDFYVESGYTFKFEVVPSSIYENTQSSIRYSIVGDGDYSMNSLTGVLTVNSLSDTQHFATVQAVVSESGVSNTITKEIEIWNRPAQLGDLVYADGTFGAAKYYEGDKTPIGICFYVAPRNSDGSVNTKFNNPNDKQLRLMVALEDTVVPFGGTESSYLQWGSQALTSNGDAWNEQYALYDTNSEGTRVNLTSESSNVSSVYNISAIRDLGNSGLSNGYINPDPTTNPNGESDYRGLDTEDEVTNDGFKCIEPSYAMGDGFAYNESATYLKERTLDDALAKLAGDGYQSGDVVNSAYAKTLKVIAHRNNLLGNNIIGADNEVIYTGGMFEMPKASGNLTEIEALGSLIDNLRAWASNTLQDAYPNKWSQLCYPYVSACYAYEPKVVEGETLSPKFKAHNWFALTEGLIARVCWYVKYGEVGGMDVFKDARDKGLVKFAASSYHWSVTEYYTGSSWLIDFHNGGLYYYTKFYSVVGRAGSAF